MNKYMSQLLSIHPSDYISSDCTYVRTRLLFLSPAGFVDRRIGVEDVVETCKINYMEN